MHQAKYHSTLGVPTEKPSQMATVWDLPLRLFHWAMVLVVVVAAITGYLAPEWMLDIHVYAGYGLGVLLGFRLVWGLLGSTYSRFRSFPLKPGAVSNHLSSLLRGAPKEHVGHNPLGAWMILVLLLTLVGLALSGVVVLGGQENLGPLAAYINFEAGDLMAEFHEALAGLLLGAIVIHLTGVLVEVKIFRHPVLKAMISGKKPIAAGSVESAGPGLARGIILFGLVLGVLLASGLALTAHPTSAWYEVEIPSVYTAECGDCHEPYHPSLRVASDWRKLMMTLESHYGEDASLDTEAEQQIGRFLNANGASRFDTEVAHKIGRVETASMRMTETRYWKRRHREIDDAVFKHKSVVSKVNCNGCHSDAKTGRFDDAKIHLPNGDKK